MRSAFGNFSDQLRNKRDMTQTEFAKKADISLARISNIEHQRTSISDDVVRVYLRVLECSGEVAHELRKRASFSNEVRKRTDDHTNYAPLQVMFEQFGDKISPETAAKIQHILERETGELVEALRFSSNMTVSSTAQRNAKLSKRNRPSLRPKRLAEIAIKALDLRREICADHHPIDVGLLLQRLSSENENFDYIIRESLPSYMEGAFACIIGDASGHTIVLEEKRFQSAAKGVHFARHVISHEIGHHILHPYLLKSDSIAVLPPQELSRNSSPMIGSTQEIQQVVNTIEEVEAECFATFLLVPWESFLKGTSARYLATDYGEQQREVERYLPYFKIRSVLDKFREILWERGERQHPIFANQQ